jgi:hypothetical protein
MTPLATAGTDTNPRARQEKREHLHLINWTGSDMGRQNISWQTISKCHYGAIT